ncbi:MAG: multicopper oxidase domain-containing protein [Planctomycetes bacterium]|nr:multicopper oxidase domain-containing protein [Planctomycetota bacterium]
MNRRDLLRLSIIGGGLAWTQRRPLFAGPLARPFDDLPPSPTTTPFVTPLPAPPVLTPVAPFAAPDVTFPPQAVNAPTYYKIISEERFVSLHPELPPTRMWGYRDANVANWPYAVGPTIVARAEHPIVVRHENQLPANHVGFGVPEETVHFHGGHMEARSDGFPESLPGYTTVFGPGEHYDYGYAMLDPGFSHGAPDASDRPSTLWYHDHLLDFTAQNVYRGLVGLFLFQDELDTLDETTGLRLPSGEFDVPLAFQDKRLDDQGQLAYDVFDHNGFLGDKWLVNGAIQPYLNVKRRKYRFRLLNGCNARFLGLRLVRQGGSIEPFDLIATEGGLLSAPLRNRNLAFLSPAQREDIVVDFARYPAGTVLFFENRLRQDDGRGPSGTFDQPELLNRGPRFLKIVVGADAPDPSVVPNVLRPFTAITQAEINAATRRTFEFKRRNGVWVINGQAVDLTQPMATVQENAPEIWRLKNGSGGWWHPIHIHLEFMHVLKRNGQVPPPDERDGIAKRDVITLGPNDEVEVFLKFRDFRGRWVMHCHTIEHEDAFMMMRFDVV